MSHTINLAIQVIPKVPAQNLYAVIDKAIEVIQQSGLAYKVCPFETVIEGPYEKVMETAEAAQQACFAAGADEVLVFMKLQRRKNADVAMEEKVGKYR
ncbi:MAG: hypothetical protein FD123_852 [Bacteroidetes bacterium]|nr:MAG: hypothetical protein FD123_852 [Bacteroidota bacterium]